MPSVPLALLFGRLLPGAQGCVSDLTSACVILSFRAPTEPSVVPLPSENSCAPKTEPEEKPSTEDPSVDTEAPAPRPKRSFEEDTEDEDSE